MNDTAARWSDRLALGEGSRWVEDRLVLVDILTGRLLEETPDPSGPLRVLAALPFPLGAVAPVAGAPGRWIAAAGTGVCLLGPGAEVEWLARPEDGTPRPSRMNDGVADAAGRFWAGSMAYDATPRAASLYRVDHDGTVTRVVDGLTVANGPAFTADGRVMYLADTPRGTVRRYPVDPATGTLGEPEEFVRIPPGQGMPDGMTVDREGGVWIALWGGSAVRRYLPDGTLDRTLPVPAAQPTSVCLGGPAGRTLHITSAATGLDPAGEYDGAVFTAEVEVPGTPAAYYRPAPGGPS
jgi:sugar lactone lactonase YvrE